MLDALLLDIGTPGRVLARPGWVRTSDGSAADPAGVAAAAKGVRFVFVGESHDNPWHHQAQASVIEALVAEGRRVVVGFEMFTRDNQANLAPWTLGRWDEATFLERAQWKAQWGFDFALYRPVFESVRRHRLEMVALNVPRQWVRDVARNGPGTLEGGRREWVPELDLGQSGHRRVFDSLMDGHPPGSALEGMYAGQVTWDTGMAQSALDAMAKSANPNRVMVVVAGIGHTLYGQGINLRIALRTGERTVSAVCIESDGPREVSRGVADFVFTAPPAARG
jgi:uncharacterized iron-regulated protein